MKYQLLFIYDIMVRKIIEIYPIKARKAVNTKIMIGIKSFFFFILNMNSPRLSKGSMGKIVWNYVRSTRQ